MDLTTGTLALDPVDVDLGNGLRFARHYASGSTDVGQIGKAWRHSIEWKLTKLTLSSVGWV